MPCAIVVGAAPVIAYTGAEKLAIDQDEMAVAGGLAGVAIRTAKAFTVDLEVPADAEIVIEGLIDTDMLKPEGPFGECNGYVALEDFNMSMQVTAITHRRARICFHHQPGIPERIQRHQEAGAGAAIFGAFAQWALAQNGFARRHARAA